MLTTTATGPSPQVRGSRERNSGHGRRQGSIPAGAGEPSASVIGGASTGVHPRRCGGAHDGQDEAGRFEGPSPQVRGSLAVADVGVGDLGSIPAGAGEPSRRRARSGRRRVHPRRCGGARGPYCPSSSPRGPSPQVRGSQVGAGRGSLGNGSIPAGAGEPRPARQRSSGSRVHPRRCGGAGPMSGDEKGDKGPSPQVRGSPRTGLRDDVQPGSIPAGAGEPGTARSWRGGAGVHPRRCGGAGGRGGRRKPDGGPSPQVRGSPSPRRRHLLRGGSIPAGAGEPLELAHRSRCHGVHPRRCGGAAPHGACRGMKQGPSPQVRGSRNHPDMMYPARGSIPAGAGEPGPRSTGQKPRRVHPRRCGGA